MFDGTVNSPISRLTNNLPRIFQRPTVAHCYQKIYDNSLECRRTTILHDFEHFFRQRITKHLKAAFELFLGCQRRFLPFRGWSYRFQGGAAFIHLHDLRILMEGFDCDLR